VPIIIVLKGRWGLNGRSALWLSAIVAALLAVIALLITQKFAFVDFSPTEIFAAFGQVLAAATLAHKLLTE
jgi:hypothetical protein